MKVLAMGDRFMTNEVLTEAFTEATKDLGIDFDIVYLEDQWPVEPLLAARDIYEVHVEAGPTLCGALLQAGLVDELLLYLAPLLMGDSARPLLAGLGIETMAQTVPLEIADTRMLGKDLRLLLRPA